MPEEKVQIPSIPLVESAPFVGRAAALRTLRETLKLTLAGQGQVCFIAGEGGSGKTTLITEFARRVQPRRADLVVALGTCNAQTGIGDSYLPFREVLQLFIDVERPTARGTVTPENRRRLQGVAQLSAQALAEIGPDLIGVFLPGVGLLAKLGAFVADKAGWLEARQEKAALALEDIDESRIFEQYAAVLRQLATQHPLILVLDDLQWVDQASASLLFYLIRQLRESRVLIVGLYRPAEVAVGRAGQRHPLAKVLAETKRYYGDVVLDLEQTGKAEGRQFVEALVDTEPNRLGADFRAALFQHTEGHPLFTVELLRHLQERGDLARDADGAWVEAAPITWDTLPARVEGVIAERIERLAEELKVLLLTASVEGEEFTAQVVARVENLPERHLLRRLCQELEQQHRLIGQQGELAVGAHILARFRFSHNLFQRHFYQLTGAESRTLHGEIGAALEELYAGQTEAIVLQLAWHFEAAGVWGKAVAYRLRAGAQARQRYACADAIAHFDHALALAEKLTSADSLKPRLQALTALGELLTITGQHEPARARLEAALTAAREVGDQDQEALICRWQARSYENAGEYPLALEWVQRGLAALQGRELAEAVQLRLIAGLVHLRRGEVDAALEQAQLTVRIAQALNDLPALGRTYLLLAVLTLQRGQNQRSVELAQRGLDYYTQADDLAGQATAYNQIANALFNMGRWSEAAQNYGQARDTFQRIGDLYNRAIAENNLGELALNQGRLEEALIAYQAALRLLEQIGSSPYILGILHNNLGAVYVRRGELAAAREQLQASLTRFELAESRDILPEVARHLAEIARQEGDMQLAEAEAQRSLALARELQAENEAGITLRLLGELALARGEHSAAAARLRESLAILLKLGETYQAACTHLALARLALAVGRPADARAELDACEPVFAQLDAAPDLAVAQEVRSKMEI